MRDEIKKYWSELKSGTKLMFKEFFNKETNKKQRANMWTFSRLVISFLIPICSLISILTTNLSLFITSMTITGFGALTDFFDGRSARKYNSYSEYGRFLDQVADKIFSIMIGINLSLFNPLFLITLLGEGIIVATNIPYMLKYNDLKIQSTKIGKIKQWPLFASLVLGFISTILSGLSIATNISILLTFLLQLATAISYIKSNNESVKLLKDQVNNDLINIENNYERDKEKVKTKTIESKNSNIIETDKNISRSSRLEDLRKLRDEFISSETNIDSFGENSHQKTKK